MLRSKFLTVLTVVLFIFGIAIVGLAQAQKAKTVKLPNGEEVVAISGEWDAQIENYGTWSQYDKYPNVLKITLEGSSFVAIRMKAAKYHAPGSESMRGELDKDGIKKLQLMTGYAPIDATGWLMPSRFLTGASVSSIHQVDNIVTSIPNNWETNNGCDLNSVAALLGGGL